MYEVKGSLVVGEFIKNKTQYIIAYLSRFEGAHVAHLRTRKGMRLTEKGVSVRVEQLPQLLELVKALQREAKAMDS